MTSRGGNKRLSGRRLLLAAALLLLAAAQSGCYGSERILGMMAENIYEAIKGDPTYYELRNVSEPPIKADAGRLYVYLSPSIESDSDDRRFNMGELNFYEKDEERTALVLDRRVLRAYRPCTKCIPGVVSVDLAPGSYTLQAVNRSRVAIQKFTIEIQPGKSNFVRISLDDSNSRRLVFKVVASAVGRREAAGRIYAPADFEKLEPLGFIRIQSDVPGKLETGSPPAAASAPQSGRQLPLRLAQFPAINWYVCDEPRDEPMAARAIGRSLSSNSQLKLVFSAFRNQRGQNKLPEDVIEDMNFYQWSIAGPGLIYGPEFTYFVETGNKLDVDAVVLISYNRGCEKAKGDFLIWLIELKIMQDYYVRFYTQNYSVAGHDELVAAMNGFLNVHLPLLNGKSGSM